MEKFEHLGLRITLELKESIQRAARAEERSVSYIVMRAVREWLVNNAPPACEECRDRPKLRGYRVCAECWGDRPTAAVLDDATAKG